MAYSHILVGASTTPARPDAEPRCRPLCDLSSAWPPLIAMTLGYSMPLAFPLAAGFAFLGPLAAIGL
jgi:hypothetical protein